MNRKNNCSFKKIQKLAKKVLLKKCNLKHIKTHYFNLGFYQNYKLNIGLRLTKGIFKGVSNHVIYTVPRLDI